MKLKLVEIGRDTFVLVEDSWDNVSHGQWYLNWDTVHECFTYEDRFLPRLYSDFKEGKEENDALNFIVRVPVVGSTTPSWSNNLLDINEIRELLKNPNFNDFYKGLDYDSKNHQYVQGWKEGYQYAYETMYTEAEMKLAFTSNSFHDKFDEWIAQLRRPRNFWYVKYDKTGKLTFDYHV